MLRCCSHGGESPCTKWKRHTLWDCPAIDNMSYSVVTDTLSLGDMALRDVRQTRLNGQDGLLQERDPTAAAFRRPVHRYERARDGVGQLQRLLHRWIWRKPYVNCRTQEMWVGGGGAARSLGLLGVLLGWTTARLQLQENSWRPNMHSKFLGV